MVHGFNQTEGVHGSGAAGQLRGEARALSRNFNNQGVMEETGFLQESPGNNSSTRLCMVMLCVTLCLVILYQTYTTQTDIGLYVALGGLAFGGKIVSDKTKQITG